MIEDRSTDQTIRLELELPIPPNVAWRVLTEEEHVAAWWGDHVTLEARPKGAFVERWSDGRRDIVTAGVVTRSDPPYRIGWTWSDHD